MKSAFPPSAAAAKSAVSTRRGPWRAVWPWLFWALWGVWLAASDLRNDDVQSAVVLLLVGAFVLGFARPRHWWAWAIALGAWVPAEPLLAAVTRTPMAYAPNWGALIAFLPALAGAGVGAALASSRREKGSADPPGTRAGLS
ncbi:MAG: hypothetical protein HZA61_07175 [Candidatus Eisenbacteria bacterium]|uniref:Uncharacterized protein n=1 Tax=Eiseniibacteriota bacterium TaxID=2212470 RepID=A0A933SF52_UNCEI|nr:hypothetical protein [Candidatus Eisenbacteria bacterium]